LKVDANSAQAAPRKALTNITNKVVASSSTKGNKEAVHPKDAALKPPKHALTPQIGSVPRSTSKPESKLAPSSTRLTRYDDHLGNTHKGVVSDDDLLFDDPALHYRPQKNLHLLDIAEIPVDPLPIDPIPGFDLAELEGLDLSKFEWNPDLDCDFDDK